jgi:hypothetical protein
MHKFILTVTNFVYLIHFSDLQSSRLFNAAAQYKKDANHYLYLMKAPRDGNM